MNIRIYIKNKNIQHKKNTQIFYYFFIHNPYPIIRTSKEKYYSYKIIFLSLYFPSMPNLSLSSKISSVKHKFIKISILFNKF